MLPFFVASLFASLAIQRVVEFETPARTIEVNDEHVDDEEIEGVNEQRTALVARNGLTNRLNMVDYTEQIGRAHV